MDNLKIIYILLISLFIHCSKEGDDITGNNYQLLYKNESNFKGSNTTLDIVTWNIENFPLNNTTPTYVEEIIDSLDADIIAMQEIKGIDDFNNMVNSLTNKNWIGFRAGDDEGSYDENYQELAYLINTSFVSINNNPYSILGNYGYYFAYREPFILEFTFENIPFILINNHYKCCGDGDLNLDDSGDEETRRYTSNNLLKDYIDNYFSNANVIVVGDFNDDLTDIQENNVFQQFLNDETNYQFVDFSIASGPIYNWSFPNWPSHLDHILITNELFDNIEDIQTILLRENNYYTYPGVYENNVSDHQPVGIKLFFEP